MRPWLGLMMSLVLAPQAWADDCPEAYTIDGLLTDLAMTEGALRSADNVGAGESAAKMAASLECSEDIIPGAMTARIYRAIGGGLFASGDPDGGLMWLRTSAELEPGYEYGEGDLPAEHPVRAGLKLAKVEVMGTVTTPMSDAQDLGAGKHYLDGLPIERPTATMERYHVYQRVQDSTWTFVIPGNEFPDEAFGSGSGPGTEEDLPDDPIPTEPVVPEATVVKQKNWPAERVALIGLGGASVAASGALYALSASSRANFDKANSVADVDKYTRSTNTFVIASGATGAAGVGMLGFGVLFFVVDGDPRPTLDIRF